MKHAYLILAHNEFDLLKKLIEVLDDVRNDIFIHYDIKVNDLPSIISNYSKLYILDERIDVRWGDVSVVAAEYALFEKAFATGDYSYFHLLSGVDLPLRSQDFIHDFFLKNQGKEFIGFNQSDSMKSLDRKVNRFHFFAKDFKGDGSLSSSLKKVIRAVMLRAQFLFGVRRNRGLLFKKGTQWISVTGDFVRLVLRQKKLVLTMYGKTFCADEIFIQTICWNSDFRPRIYDFENEGRGCQRMIGWKDNRILDWTDGDFEKLIDSNLLFARKFSSKHIGVVERIVEYCIKPKSF